VIIALTVYIVLLKARPEAMPNHSLVFYSSLFSSFTFDRPHN
jgi:hypothetical protein